jgi:hypothetical protein
MDQRAHLHTHKGRDPWEFPAGHSSKRPREESVQRAADTAQGLADRPKLGRPATQPPQPPRIPAQPPPGVDQERPREEPTRGTADGGRPATPRPAGPVLTPHATPLRVEVKQEAHTTVVGVTDHGSL